MIVLFPLLSCFLGCRYGHTPYVGLRVWWSASRFPGCSGNLRLTFFILFLVADSGSGLNSYLSYVSTKPAAVGLSCCRCLSFVCSLIRHPPCFLTALRLAQLFYSARIPLRAHERPCPVEKRYRGLRLVRTLEHLKRTGGANHE